MMKMIIKWYDYDDDDDEMMMMKMMKMMMFLMKMIIMMIIYFWLHLEYDDDNEYDVVMIKIITMMPLECHIYYFEEVGQINSDGELDGAGQW